MTTTVRRRLAVVCACMCVVVAAAALLLARPSVLAALRRPPAAASPEWTTLPIAAPPRWAGDALPAPEWRAMWAVEVENRAGGRIVLHRRGQAPLLLGKVIHPARRYAFPKGFYAAAYLPGGTVSACSRKVLRIRAHGAVVAPREVAALRGPEGIPLVNLLPADWRRGYETVQERRGIERERPAARTHIWTDCKETLFGRWAPPAGSPVFYRSSAAGRWRPLNERKPTRASPVPDRLLMLAIRTRRWPSYLEIENWTAGDVQRWRSGRTVRVPAEGLPERNGRVRVLWDAAGRGEATMIGSVYQRVSGVGRFDDTGMVATGRIATNHPGDLAIATGPGVTIPIRSEAERNIQGGFQIIPLRHAWYGMQADQPGYAGGSGPWLVVGPPRDQATPPLREFLENGAADAPQGLEGRAPLFAGYFTPRAAPEERRPARLPPTRRGYLVLVSTDFGRTWEPVPQRQGYRPSALDSVTHIRIFFPTLME